MFAPGPGEAPSPANQVHDFNPGISPEGVFWTTALPFDSVKLSSGSASMQATDLAVPDYHDLINALFGSNPPVAGLVSYDVRWGDATERVNFRNVESGLAATLQRGSATIDWTGRNADFEYVSDAADTSITLIAEWGRERNGVFFAP